MKDETREQADRVATLCLVLFVLAIVILVILAECGIL
jgi:hypothetical protein